MLGCQDFCGYYEWTFHFLRQKFGQFGLEKYWAQAVAADAQQHYIRAGSDNGLRGLYESWFKTGVDEHCEWTVTLAEDCNLLRLDMRECPSKGFLLQNNLNADEDYCDHCVGWIGPALNAVGAEVVAHEHNHCGQCWWEMRMKDQKYTGVEVAADIRNDPRWRNGYLDHFQHHTKLPIVELGTNVDPSDVITNWFREFDRIIIVNPTLGSENELRTNDPKTAVIVSGQEYAARNWERVSLKGVILDHDQSIVPGVAKQFLATTSARQPLLMHAYLPQAPVINFVDCSLPRPVPILPLLIRSGIYEHRPQQASPTSRMLALLLAAALNKEVVVTGESGSVLPARCD
jgi:hypothetical protein